MVNLSPYLLNPVAPSFFFSRNDPDDPRMGDLVLHDLDELPDGVRVALIGVPQDIGVARNGGRVGAADGPDAIRGALYRMTPYDMVTGRSLRKGSVVDLGNISTAGELEDIHGRIEEVVASVCRAGVRPIVLGGGHDITYPSARGAAAVYGSLGAFNFDAHLDVRPPVPQRNSGTSFRMLIDEGIVRAGSCVEFGIQSFANAAGHVEWFTDAGGGIIPLNEIRERGFDATLHEAIDLAASEVNGIYATLDIDAIQGSDAPGVSAVMPDGFTAQQFLQTARALGANPNVVAFDIAELNPKYDIDNRTAKLAARGVMEIIIH